MKKGEGQDKNIKFCRKCGRRIGVVVNDAQAFRAGRILIWQRVRVTCADCGHGFMFCPLLPKDDALTPDQKVFVKELLNDLAKTRQNF